MNPFYLPQTSGRQQPDAVERECVSQLEEIKVLVSTLSKKKKSLPRTRKCLEKIPVRFQLLFSACYG